MESKQGWSYKRKEEAMILTDEQNKEIKKMDRRLKELFPDFFGSVRFNLNPKIKNCNINVVENIIE